MEGLFTNLGIEWKVLIAQIINFGILAFILSRFLYKPILRVLDERKKKVIEDRERSLRLEEKLKEVETLKSDVFAKARAEAEAVFQSGKKHAEEKRNEILESTKTSVEVMLATGKKTMEAEKTKMMEEAKQEIVNLVMETSKKVLNSDALEFFDKKALKELEGVK